MTDKKYWDQDWTALTAKERREVLVSLSELTEAAGFSLKVRKRFTAKKDPRYQDNRLTAGALTSFDRRIILLFTHQHTKAGKLKPFKLYQFISNYFHELGHVVGLELQAFYEVNGAAKTKKEWLVSSPKTALDTIYRFIGGEMLAEIRGKVLATIFYPGFPFHYTYEALTFEYNLEAMKLDCFLFEENVRWDYSGFKHLPDDDPVPVIGEDEVFGSL